jgi:hypothetical protein
MVDGETGHVGINEDSLDADLHITGSPVVLKMERTGVRALRMGVPDNSSDFVFADSDDLKSNQRLELTGGGDVYVVNNLGVGTASPATKLDIIASGANGLVLNNDSSNSANSARLFFEGTSTSAIFQEGGDFSFRINSTTGSSSGTERMKIMETGMQITNASLGVNVAPNGTNGRIDAGNDVVAFSTSDKRLKENIKPLDSALDKVLQINGVSFDWKELTEKEKKTIHGNQGHDVGVIAQEIEEVLPEVVTTRDSGYKAVKYEKIVPLLIEAIKEQQKQIEELKNG